MSYVDEFTMLEPARDRAEFFLAPVSLRDEGAIAMFACSGTDKLFRSDPVVRRLGSPLKLCSASQRATFLRTVIVSSGRVKSSFANGANSLLKSYMFSLLLGSVPLRVLVTGKQLQIFNSIVSSVSVLMMDMLVRFKSPAQKLAHYIPMLKHFSTPPTKRVLGSVYYYVPVSTSKFSAPPVMMRGSAINCLYVAAAGFYEFFHTEILSKFYGEVKFT